MTRQRLSLPDGPMTLYVAKPAVTPAPCLIVIQEIFGVNAEIRARCDAYAEKGYLAIAPDLFWRLEPDVDLTDQTQEEWDKALELMRRFNVDQGVRDLKEVLAFARNRPECDGFVADIGFCLGGKLSYLMAARTDVDASVSYYGVGLQDMLGEMAAIQNPLLLHIAAQDKFTPPTAQHQIVSEAKEHELVTVFVYPDNDHAFARKGGEHYDPIAAKLAEQRSFEFLEQARQTR